MSRLLFNWYIGRGAQPRSAVALRALCHLMCRSRSPASINQSHCARLPGIWIIAVVAHSDAICWKPSRAARSSPSWWPRRLLRCPR
eukprot:15001171-Alexandrium_andersonii.AAC.1